MRERETNEERGFRGGQQKSELVGQKVRKRV